MSHKLPVGNYEWMTPEEIKDFDIAGQDFESETGHVFSVTLSYPESLHLDHNSFPLAAEHIKVPHEELSQYSQDCLNDLLFKYVPVSKLSSTFKTRNNYVVHGMNLKLYLELGMKLEEIHFGIKFEQGDYMADFVKMQSEARRNAVSQVESMIAKRMFFVCFFTLYIYKHFFFLGVVNSVFGKMIESGSNRMDMRFARSRERSMMLNTDPRFAGFKICGNNLVIELLKKKFIELRRHWMIGFSILELSKYVMCSIFYKIIQPTFEKQVQLVFTDTDSFALILPVESAEKACEMLSPIMDFSNYDSSHRLYNSSLKNVTGYLKNENPNSNIIKICALKAKTYAYVTDKISNKIDLKSKCKGVRKAARNKLKFEHYQKCLEQFRVQKITQYSIMAKDHVNRLVETRKISFTSFDDKRYYMCSIHSVPYGSILIEKFKQMNNQCYFCMNPNILR